MICSIDGDALCITREDFIDLVQSPAVFIDLTLEQAVKIRGLENASNEPMAVGELREATKE